MHSGDRQRGVGGSPLDLSFSAAQSHSAECLPYVFAVSSFHVFLLRDMHRHGSVTLRPRKKTGPILNEVETEWPTRGSEKRGSSCTVASVGNRTGHIWQYSTV